MKENELLEIIQKKLTAFNTNPNQATIDLFKALHYPTDIELNIKFENYEQFKKFVVEKTGNTPKNEKLLTQHWKKASIPFRISDTELQQKNSMFKAAEKPFLDAYLWFVIELDEKIHYKRTELADFTREINQIFQNGVMPIFKIGQKITLGIIDRRKNKKDDSKNILLKVTFVKDIDIQNPKRSHLEILADLAFDKLKDKKEIKNFIDIHYAWQEILSISELNKKFYKEISNWYFWAVDKCKFPIAEDKTQKQTNQIAIIRLLTRFIFVWFIKEKNLIAEKLFEENYLNNTLKDFKNGNHYYKAILQNLFFATLNREKTERGFAENKSFVENRTNNDVNTFYRYEHLFIDENPTNIMKIFEQTPFLNGGLFDSLDKKDKDKKQYFDGFTRIEKYQPDVPDFLFFGEEENSFSENLKTIYEIKDKKTTLQVKGIVKILKKYKFTIEENTPLEEDIALDPELLGQIFESLLAYYNPETASTARKDTGSFYTPREIVNYMVDESILAYLKKDFPTIENFDELKNIDKTQTEKIIRSLANIKILDPACGSGAFPMGILHKIVTILQTLDKDNNIWRKIQKEKLQKELEQIYDIKAQDERQIKFKELDDIFEHNLSDYGRKLFIIQNCIYGIDIQNIAIQISKLRFFLSLVIEQKNENIKPLPNLETKFVTANTLVGLEKPKQQGQLKNLRIEELEIDLAENRQKYFAVKNKTQKNKLVQKDKEIRTEIATLLEKGGWGKTTAQKIADFDLFDQNASADWFDMELMFGMKDGFDIVLGNPPYGFRTTLTKEEKEYFRKVKKIEFSSGDSAELFTKISFDNFVNDDGILSFIIPKKSLYGDAWEDVRVNYWKKYDLIFLADTGKSFEKVLLEASIFGLKKSQNNEKIQLSFLKKDKSFEVFNKVDKSFIFSENNTCQIYKTIYPKDIFEKIQAHKNPKVLVKGKLGLAIGTDFFSDEPQEYKLLKGIDIGPYAVRSHRYLKNADKLNWKNVQEIMRPKVICQRIIAHIENPSPHLKIIAAYDEEGLIISNTLMHFELDESLQPKFWLAYLNSTFVSWYAYNFVYARAIRTMDFINAYIQQIPIPLVTEKEQSIFVCLVDYILFLKKQNTNTENTNYIGFLYSVLNGLVFELFYGESMKKQNKDIFKFFDNIPSINDIENETQQLLIIQQTLKPMQEVEKSVYQNLYYLDSVPEISIIYNKI